MGNQRLQDLLKAYEAGGLTSEEVTELHGLLAKDWAVTPLNLEAPSVNWEQMYRNIIPDEKKQKEYRGKIFRMNRKWFTAVAAVMLAVVSTWLVFKATQSSRQPRPTAYNAAPGANKATLTLGNGRIIQLDTASQIITDVNGIKMIDFNKGQLVFNTTADSNPSDISYNLLSTPRGGQYQAVLPDGSKVWLNAASSIRFPSGFTGDERRVEITGEAYLEVAKNAIQPFYVTAGTTEVEVLGTSFNINSYNDEPAIQTTLVEGSVRVKSTVVHHPAAVILLPGQQAQQNGELRVQQANIEQVLAWKNGYFNFNGLTLQEILRSIARWYDMDVVYEGTIAPEKFGGSIQRELNLSEILDVLKQTGVHFRIDHKKLIVMP